MKFQKIQSDTSSKNIHSGQIIQLKDVQSHWKWKRKC